MTDMTANRPFRFEVDGPNGTLTTQTIERPLGEESGAFHRYEAGAGDPHMTLICGNFKAHHGNREDLFDNIQTPVVEHFTAEDRLDERMQDAFAELLRQEQADGTMAASLPKQVVVKLLRRSMASKELWVERLSVLQDASVARAFAAMVARPGAHHTTETLAEIAGTSRSVFMDRFARLFNQSPIAILRHLRLDLAKNLLERTITPVDRVAHEIGYANRDSFVRAFKEEFGQDPAAYRERNLTYLHS